MTAAAPLQAAAVGNAAQTSERMSETWVCPGKTKDGASVPHSLVRRRATPCGSIRSSSGPAGLSCGIATGLRGSSSSSCSSTSSSRGGRSSVAQLRRANVELLRTNSELERTNASLRANNAELERQLDDDGIRFLEALAELQTEVQTLAEQREVLQHKLLVACQARVEHAIDKNLSDASTDAPTDAMAALQQELQDVLRQFEEFQEEHDEELRAARSENNELQRLLEKQNADMELQLAEAEQARENVTQSMIEEGTELQARIEKLIAEKEALSLLLREKRPLADGEAVAQVTTPTSQREYDIHSDCDPFAAGAPHAANSHASGLPLEPRYAQMRTLEVEQLPISSCSRCLTLPCRHGCCWGLRYGNRDAGPCWRFGAAVTAAVTTHPAPLLALLILLALVLLLACSSNWAWLH
mmetsp:Transcript_38154/g.75667  ORF Transcript_38154/g.75667 Transcript_38154/m.75667 type:complete len:413 (+) Transcript_38154:73-1311(+)